MCRCSPFLDQQTHASNEPQPIPPLGTLLQVTLFVFPSEATDPSQKGTWILTSKVLSQVLEILLNLLKCFVSHLPRNILNKNQGSLKITTTSNIKMTPYRPSNAHCDCMEYLVFHGSRSLGKASYRFTKATI